MADEKDEYGTLKLGEIHPASHGAMTFVKEYMMNDMHRLFQIRESFASCALSGNRLAAICGETLSRILDGKPVSDRYLLGLAWTLNTMDEEDKKKYVAEQAKDKQKTRKFVSKKKIKDRVIQKPPKRGKLSLAEARRAVRTVMKKRKKKS